MELHRGRLILRLELSLDPLHCGKGLGVGSNIGLKLVRPFRERIQ